MMENKAKTIVLIVDDEPQIRRLLRVTLESNGYQVFDATTGNDGIAQAAQRRPEIILLDLGLPDIGGLEVLRRLREWTDVPVIILSVRDQEEDKVAALDSGADDYVLKPFGSSELLARIRANLRHTQVKEVDAIIKFGNIEVDLSTRQVRKAAGEVKLTPIEYDLLRLLITNAGKVLTHKYLLTTIWGPKAGEQTHYLRVHMAHLREKLEEKASEPKFFITEPAVGYRFISA